MKRKRHARRGGLPQVRRLRGSVSCVDGPCGARGGFGVTVPRSGANHVSGLTWGSLRQAGLAASGCAGVRRWPDGPRRSSHHGGSPHQPHIRRDQRFQPRSRIRDGGAPRGRHHSIKRRGRALPDNGDATLDWSGQARRNAVLAGAVSQVAGLKAAPSGTTLGRKPPQRDQKWLLSGSGVMGSITRPERRQGRREGLCRGAGVVHELEEAEIQRQLLLRDTPVRAEPGAQ